MYWQLHGCAQHASTTDNMTNADHVCLRGRKHTDEPIGMYQTLSRVLARPQKKLTVSLRKSGDSTLPKADSSICSKDRRSGGQ